MKPKYLSPFLIFLLALLPAIVKGHPGIGIVKDSKGNIYYNQDRLWVLESSDKNEVRVTVAGKTVGTVSKANSNHTAFIVISGMLIDGIISYALFARRNRTIRVALTTKAFSFQNLFLEYCGSNSKN